MSALLDILKFILFLLFGVFIPGYVIVQKAGPERMLLTIFLSLGLGLTLATLVAFVNPNLLYVLAVAATYVFIKKKSFKDCKPPKPRLSTAGIVLLLLILLGVIFQNL